MTFDMYLQTITDRALIHAGIMVVLLIVYAVIRKWEGRK